MFQKPFVLISLALHLAFLGFLAFELRPEVPLQKLAVEIEWQETTSSESNLNLAKDPSSNSNPKNGRGSLQKYMPRFSAYNPDSPAFGRGQDGKGAESIGRDNPDSEWGSGTSRFERIADYNFFKVLYGQVDGVLYYPGVLARHKIMGVVNARVVFDSSGDCNWQRTRIQGHNAYLELYVLDLLKGVCKMNYKHYLNQRSLTNADLSFQFDINENDDFERIQKQKLIVGNALLFYRNSHQSIAEWELGPFKGVFPIPAVYLNIPWLQENWDHLIHNKDPMNEFKKEFGSS